MVTSGVDSLRAHCVRRLRRACARVRERASGADETIIRDAFDARGVAFGSERTCEAVVSALFELGREKCAVGDADDAREGRACEDGGRRKRAKVSFEKDSEPSEGSSRVMGWVQRSCEALARNFTAERARCARVFAEASKRPEEGFDEEVVKAEVLMAMEKSDRDRERSMWRREVIVSHHRALRADARETEDAKKTWERVVSEDGAEALRRYAEAATEVGNRAWVVSALEWCVNAIGLYFGDAERCAPSETAPTWATANKRRARALARERGEPFESVLKTIVESEDALGTPDRRVAGKVLKLLDVGSCWDYFNVHFKGPWPGNLTVDAVACDLCPAVPSVYRCDWLNVRFGDEERVEPASREGESAALEAVREHDADVVVFSLVLSYLPTPKQRGEMVRRARLALKNRGAGLFFVITPHSTDKGHCPHKALPVLAEWREAFLTVGFDRIAYERHRSVHCLAFRTIGDGDEARAAEGSPPELRIAFDSQR